MSLVLLTLLSAAIGDARAERPAQTLPGLDYPTQIILPSGTPPGAMAPLVPSRGITVPAGDPAAELSSELQKYSQQIESLNRLNPASGGSATAIPALGGEPPPGSAEGAEGAEGDGMLKFLMDPGTQRWLHVFADPKLRDSALSLSRSPDRAKLAYCEIGFMLSLLVFRAWRHSKTTKWYAKLWVSAYTLGLYWVGALYAIPSLVLGDEYGQLVRALFRAFWA